MSTPTKENKESSKIPEKIHPKTLLTAILTALTVALVSLSLTNTVSSLVLVGIASVVTAFTSEFYRFLIDKFHELVETRVLKLLGENQVTITDSNTGELVCLTPEKIKEIETSSQSDPEEKGDDRRLVHRLLTSRWTNLVVFAIIGFGTVALSYTVGLIKNEPDYKITNEVVRINDVADSKAVTIKAENKEYTDARIAEVDRRLIDLIDKKAGLNPTNESLENLREELDRIKNQAPTDSPTKAELKQLTDRITELEKRLALLETQDTQPPPQLPASP